MSNAPTASASNALSKKSRIVLSNHNAKYLRVASVTATTITVDDASALTGTALYTATTPGVAVVHDGVAASDNGLIAEITGIAGNVLTTPTDLTTDIADGDLIAVYPPQAIELKPNGSHTLNLTATDDETLGLTDTFLTHNTLDTLDIGGTIPFFLPKDSHALARLLAFGFGMYKKSGTGIHDFVPVGDDDGTYADSQRASVYVDDANGVAERIFGNLFATSLSISVPETGPATGSIETMGNVYSREVGGTGKTFTSGASNYVQSDLPCESGSRFTHLHTIVEQGGSFGDAPTDAQDNFITTVDINYSKSATAPRTQGSEYPVDAEEGSVAYTVAVTRLFQDDTFFDDFHGDAADPRLGKSTDRLLVRLSDGTRTIDFDSPLGKISDHSVTRDPQGRVTESFTFMATHTTGADDCIDLTAPLVRARFDNAVDQDVLTSLSN